MVLYYADGNECIGFHKAPSRLLFGPNFSFDLLLEAKAV